MPTQTEDNGEEIVYLSGLAPSWKAWGETGTPPWTKTMQFNRRTYKDALSEIGDKT